MPPACWESEPPARRRRGSRYCRRANSTWALPSGVRAFWAKMSRITAVRSMAVRPRIFSRLRCCAGERFCSNTTVSESTARQISLQLIHLARAEERGGIGRVASLDDPRDDVGAGGVDEQGQFVELVLELLWTHTRKLDPHQHNLFAKRAVDQCGGDVRHPPSHSTFATNFTGPSRRAPPSPSVTRSAPPGLSTVTSVPVNPRW